MAVHVSCAECGREYALADAMRGKKVRCKDCGAIVEVLETGVRAEPPPMSPRVKKASPRRPERSKRRDEDDDPVPVGLPKWIWAVAGGGGALLLVGLLVVVVLATKDSEQPQAIPVVEANLPPMPPIAQPPVNVPVAPPVRPPVVQPPPVMQQKPKPAVAPPIANPPIGNLPGVPPKGIEVNPVDRGWNWKVTVDAGPEIYKAPMKPRPPAPLGSNSDVVFPTSPSEYMAIRSGNFANQVWTSIHLPTFKPLGALQGQLSLRDPAISPDGRFLAGQESSGERQVRVFSFADAKLVATFPGPGPRSNVQLVDFTADNRVLVGIQSQTTATLTVHDPATNAVGPTFSFEGALDSKRTSWSPGRRYLIVANSQSRTKGIPIFDVSQGTEVGRLPGSEGFRINTAFSPDGADIAVFVDEHNGAEIQIFDVKTGTRTAQMKFANSPSQQVPGGGAHSYPGPAIEFTPDKSALLLYGELLVANPSGAFAFKIPRAAHESVRQPRKFAGPDHFVMTSGLGSSMTIQIGPMLRTEIAALVKKAAASDVLREQLEMAAVKTPDTSAAAMMPPSAEAAPWAAGPVAVEKSRPATPFKLRMPGDDTLLILLSGVKTAQAVAVVRNAVDPLAGKDVIQADRYDLAAGRLLGTVPLFPTAGAKRAGAFGRVGGPGSNDDLKMEAKVSPDGTMLVVCRASDPGRLDVWNLVDGKHLGAFQPHGTDPVEGIALADGNRLWTTGGGNLVLWQIPEFKALVKGTGWKGRLVLSPDQKRLAVGNGRRLELLDAADGQRLGSFADPPAAESIIAGFFSPTGKEFVAAVNLGQEHSVAHWDLASGKLLGRLTVEKTSSPEREPLIAHAGPAHAFFDGKLYAWNFTSSPLLSFPKAEPRAIAASDGGFRLVTNSFKNKDTLVAVNVLPANAALLTNRLPGAEKMTPPGSKFMVQVVGPPEFQESAKRSFEAEVERLGHVVAPGGFQAVITAAMNGTGRTEQYQSRPVGPMFPIGPPIGIGPRPGIPGGGQTISIAIQEIKVELKVADAKGAIVYQSSYKIETPGSFTTKSDNPQQEIDAALWRSVNAPSIAPLSRRYRIDGQTFDLPSPAMWGF